MILAVGFAHIVYGEPGVVPESLHARVAPLNPPFPLLAQLSRAQGGRRRSGPAPAFLAREGDNRSLRFEV